MSQKKNSIFGIGPILVTLTIIYSIIISIVSKYIGEILITKWIPEYIIYFISGLLLIIGIPFFVISVKTLFKEFYKGELITEGVYGIVRNPLYSSFICFIVPGIVVLSKSLLLMTIPVFMYFVFKILINKEEVYLEKVFGQEYRDYKIKTNSIFPIKKRKA